MIQMRNNNFPQLLLNMRNFLQLIAYKLEKYKRILKHRNLFRMLIT